jgi:hypothetical protein
MTEIEEKAELVLSSLNRSVQEALDKKKRLGQYAVVWRDEKVVRLFENKSLPKQAR